MANRTPRFIPHLVVPRQVVHAMPARLTPGWGMRRQERVFPGHLTEVAAVRSFVRATLGADHPCRDECELLASETATNALLYTASGVDEFSGHVGRFSVDIAQSRRWVLVRVRDAGGPTLPCVCHVGPDATRGRGIAIVDMLANRWGFTRDGRGTCVWFELRAKRL